MHDPWDKRFHEKYERRLIARRRQKDAARRRAYAPGPNNAPYFTLTHKGLFMAKKSLADLTSTTCVDSSAPAAVDEKMANETPLLYLLLTARMASGTKARKTCSLTIFAADGVWKASLNERDKGLVLWASADELAALPGALEALLEATPIPWRSSSFGKR